MKKRVRVADTDLCSRPASEPIYPQIPPIPTRDSVLARLELERHDRRIEQERLSSSEIVSKSEKLVSRDTGNSHKGYDQR